MSRWLHIVRGACLVLVATSALATDVDVWLTRGDQVSLLSQRPALTFSTGSGSHSTKITVDPTMRYQTMDGFGASLTDSSAWLIDDELDAAETAALIEELFSPTAGLGFSVVRIPMGASDFALSAYTYDDMPAGQTDPQLNQFSISHDEAYIIPLLQLARSYNPQLKLIASPWSPPAWMKTSESLYGGSFDTSYYATYAQYFVRFVQDYEAAGVPIYAITPQNEPLNDSTAYPTMGMPTYTQSAFVGDYLGPAIVASDLDTKILIYDHNWDEWNYAIVVLNDPEAGQYAAGSSFHGYAGDVANQSLVHNYVPDKEIHFTEISGGEWSTNFGDNLVWHFQNIIIGATRNWARSVVYWNLALNQDYGPHLPGGCDTCRGVVTINTATSQVTRNVEYYILAHAAKFVRPGAQRIASDSLAGTLETVAFRNPDKSEVLVALNPNSGSTWFDLLRDGEYVSYRLVGRSVVTFIWQPPALPGDLNGDGFVDAQDALDLLPCLVGPEVAACPSGCELAAPECGDQDGDEDVDLHDFAAAARLISGG